MPVAMETTPKLRVIGNIGFTDEDVANARVWAKGKGLIPEGARGALKGDHILAWNEDGAPEFDTATVTNKPNDFDVVATLYWHKIGKNGVISQRKEYETTMTRKEVREARGADKRGRFNGEDFLTTVHTFLTEEMAPYRIVTPNGDIHDISTDSETGELSVTDNPSATKRALVARIKELEAQLAEALGEDAEAEETEAE